MAHEDRLVDLQGVEDIDHGARVLGHRGLSFDRIGTAIAGIVDGDGAPVRGEERKDFLELVHGTRDLVKQDQGYARARALLDAMHLAHRGVAEEAA